VLIVDYTYFLVADVAVIVVLSIMLYDLQTENAPDWVQGVIVGMILIMANLPWFLVYEKAQDQYDGVGCGTPWNPCLDQDWEKNGWK